MDKIQTEKKSRWWLWLLIIIILIGAGIGIYFWLFRGGGIPGGGRIPMPPALPD